MAIGQERVRAPASALHLRRFEVITAAGDIVDIYSLFASFDARGERAAAPVRVLGRLRL
jgi:hypothetical protein